MFLSRFKFLRKVILFIVYFNIHIKEMLYQNENDCKIPSLVFYSIYNFDLFD